MRLIRHVAALYAAAVGMVLLGLVALLTTLALVERTGHLVMRRGGLLLATRLALTHAVELLPEFLPVAAFVALVAVGTTMAQRGELLALQALGLRGRQISLPFVAVACLWGLMGALWADWAVPPALSHHSKLSGTAPAHGHEDALGRRRSAQAWLRQGDWLVYAPEAEPQAQRFVHPTLFRLAHGRLAEMVQAEHLTYRDDTWQLDDAIVHHVGQTSSKRVHGEPIALGGTWNDLYNLSGNPRQMRARHARLLVARRQRSGLDTTLQRVELFERFAQPWATPIWVAMAAPWALGPDRRRTLPGTLGLSALVIGSMLALAQLLRLFALTSRLPIVVGGGALMWVGAMLMPLSYWAARRLHR